MKRLQNEDSKYDNEYVYYDDPESSYRQLILSKREEKTQGMTTLMTKKGFGSKLAPTDFMQERTDLSRSHKSRKNNKNKDGDRLRVKKRRNAEVKFEEVQQSVEKSDRNISDLASIIDRIIDNETGSSGIQNNKNFTGKSTNKFKKELNDIDPREHNDDIDKIYKYVIAHKSEKFELQDQWKSLLELGKADFDTILEAICKVQNKDLDQIENRKMIECIKEVQKASGENIGQA